MKIFRPIAVSALMMAFLFLVPSSIFAQPLDPCRDPDLPPCEIPIDSNLIVLMAAAVGLAGKKAYECKRVSKSL